MATTDYDDSIDYDFVIDYDGVTGIASAQSGVSRLARHNEIINRLQGAYIVREQEDEEALLLQKAIELYLNKLH